MTEPTRDALIARCGTIETEPEAVRLRAGPHSAEFVDGALRDIRFEGVEVLRGVAFLVRDRDWGTLAAPPLDLAIEEAAATSLVTYRASCRDPAGAELAWTAHIELNPSGLSFEVHALPAADFMTNRCGFCVLHPIVGLAGAPLDVTHVDGSVEHAAFPSLIAPWQPFESIRALAHQVEPNVRTVCQMEGDAFEMEDQRNWSDASYKTYVRPLALPWPYVLPAGELVRQRVTLAIEDGRSARVAASPPIGLPATVTISLEGTAGTMPAIGLAVAPEETARTIAQAERLAEICPQHLLLHFDPTAGHGVAALRDFADLRRLSTAAATLECVVPGVDDPREELERIADQIREAGLHLDAIAVSPSVDRRSTPPGSAWPACPPLEEVYAAARAAFPGLCLGGGMFSYFTELNRKRPPFEQLDLVTHCTCPIVHAAADLSVMQTLEALPFITRSARAMFGDKPYRIGPSTIGMRQNPYGSRTFDNPDRQRLAMAAVDPRQDGLFAAAWLVGYVAATLEAALDVLTPAALTGPFGAIGDSGVRPVCAVIASLARLAGAARIGTRSSDPSRVAALAARTAGKLTVWIANLTGRPQTVAFVAPGGLAGADVHMLDERSGSQAVESAAILRCADDASGTLELLPYGAARLGLRI